MSVQINGYNIIDNSRNVTTTTKITSSTCDIPVGTTPARPSSPATGSIRYNTTEGCIEYYDGSQWILTFASSPPTFAARGVFAGGSSPPTYFTNIAYINILSASNSTPFGNLTQARTTTGASSSTRAVFSGGDGPSQPTAGSTFDYITIASAGNAINWGASLPFAIRNRIGLSNNTRGFFAGGQRPSPGIFLSTIDYITFGTTGSYSPWGALNEHGQASRIASTSTPTTGYLIGGAPNGTNVIGQFSLSSPANETNWGSLSPQNLDSAAVAGSQTGFVVAGGYRAPAPNTYTNIMDYWRYSTSAYYAFYGSLTSARGELAVASTPYRAVFAGGNTAPAGARVGTMDYIENFDSRSNAISFGTLSPVRAQHAGVSNGHAGVVAY